MTFSGVLPRILTASAAALVLTAGLAGQATASQGAEPRQAPPKVKLRLGALETGEPPTVPFMTSDGRLVDGDTDLRVKGHATTLLGERDGSYVYSRRTAHGAFKDVRQVTPEGAVTEVASIKGADQVALSDDGDWLAVVSSGRKESILRVVSVTTGNDTLDTTISLGWPNLLDVDADRAVLSSWRQRGTWSVPFDLDADVERLTRRIGYRADIDQDRLAAFTKDPYQGGCSKLSRLRRPSKVFELSCTERVEELSPSGSMSANVALLSDGIGPNAIATRTSTGRKVATYSSPYYFGESVWEDDDTLLMHVYSKRRSALVRCTAGDCEIAVPGLGRSLARVPTPGGARTPR